MSVRDSFHTPEFNGVVLSGTTSHGLILLKLSEFSYRSNVGFFAPGWRRMAQARDDSPTYLDELQRTHGSFGRVGNCYFFPLTVPAMILAVAGVASVTLRRRFTLRSAIVATTVVALLLGVATVL